jgi:hypothetical protein
MTKWRKWGITIDAQKTDESNPANWRSLHVPKLINTSNPCNHQRSMGSPNEYFEGPGVGSGGGAGVGANGKHEYWGITIGDNQANCDSSERSGLDGGSLVFLFDYPVPLDFIEIIDTPMNNVDGEIIVTTDENEVHTLPILAYGTNSYYRAEFFLPEVVVNITVNFVDYVGAISAITFCDISTRILNAVGNRVWFDSNANGIQDVYEVIGVPGVTVQLHAASVGIGNGNTNRIAETTTDENGYYNFYSLNEGEYIVTFYMPDDLPFLDQFKGTGYQGWAWSPPGQGSVQAKDSDAYVLSGNDNRAQTITIPLAGGITDLRWDAGVTVNSDLSVCIPRTGRRSAPVKRDEKKKQESRAKRAKEHEEKTMMRYKPQPKTTRHGDN